MSAPRLLPSLGGHAFGGGHHGENVRMGQGLSEPSEEDLGTQGQLVDALQDPRKCFRGHTAQGFIPAMAHARATVQIADIGGLDIDPRQIVRRTREAEPRGVLIQAHLGALEDPIVRQQFLGEHEMSLLVQLNLQDRGFPHRVCPLRGTNS